MADIFNLTDTWNAAGTTFSAIKMNVTNTASAAGSLLMDLQTGGANQFAVRKDGQINFVSGMTLGYAGGTYTLSLSLQNLTISGATAGAFTVNYPSLQFDTGSGAALSLGAANCNFGGSAVINVDYPGTAAGRLSIDAAGVVEFGRANAATKSVRLYNTYTDASNYERGVFDWNTTANTLTIGTQIAGTGIARGIEFVGPSVKIATLRRSIPVTKTADFTVADTDNYIILNKGSAGVVTLPAAASYAGREISFTNIQAFAWTSASSNVVPRIGGAAANAILAATDGAWCLMVSDGTAWVILQGTP